MPEMTRRSGVSPRTVPDDASSRWPWSRISNSYPARVPPSPRPCPPTSDARCAPRPAWAARCGSGWSCYHYLCGRHSLIQWANCGPDERLATWLTVVDSAALARGPNRATGTLTTRTPGSTPLLAADSSTRCRLRAQPLTDPAKALKALNPTVSGYAVLYFCDSRVGICDSGPYPHGPRPAHPSCATTARWPSAWG